MKKIILGCLVAASLANAGYINMKGEDIALKNLEYVYTEALNVCEKSELIFSTSKQEIRKNIAHINTLAMNHNVYIVEVSPKIVYGFFNNKQTCEGFKASYLKQKAAKK